MQRGLFLAVDIDVTFLLGHQLEITETLLTRLINGNASQYAATVKLTEALL